MNRHGETHGLLKASSKVIGLSPLGQQIPPLTHGKYQLHHLESAYLGCSSVDYRPSSSSSTRTCIARATFCEL